VVDQAILSTKGTDIAVTVGAPVVGDRVITLNNRNGAAIAVPVSAVLPGDKVTLTNTLGGTVAFMSTADSVGSGGDSEDVDPCKSLSIIVDPDDPKYFIISWVPGDNNDECHYEISTERFITVRTTGEDYATWPISTTSVQKRAIRYFTYHYVTIWGMRRGRYSKVYRMARARIGIEVVYDYLKMYVTTAYSPYPTEPRDMGGDGVSSPLYDAATESLLVVQGSADNPYVHCPPHYQFWQYVACNIALANVPLRCTCRGGISDGEFVQNTDPREFEYMAPDRRYINCGPLLHEYGSPYYEFTWPGAPSGILVDRVFGFSVWYTPPVNPAEPVSFWTTALGGPPPTQPYFSGAVITPGYLRGFPMATHIVWFSDGAVDDTWGYIAFRIADPDRGVLEIWAGVAGTHILGSIWTDKGRDKELYFGDILLCGNIDELPGATYHGYLGISLLNLDD
jgi:hypothetical protein